MRSNSENRSNILFSSTETINKNTLIFHRKFSNSFPIFIVSSLIGLEASGYISLLTQILMLATGVIAVVNAKVLQPLLKNYDRTSKSLAHDNYVKIISIAFLPSFYAFLALLLL